MRENIAEVELFRKEFSRHLATSDLNPDRATDLVDEAVTCMIKALAGIQFYIPKKVSIARRNREIIRRRTPNNANMLAAEYGLSRRQIEYITAQKKK